MPMLIACRETLYASLEKGALVAALLQEGEQSAKDGEDGLQQRQGADSALLRIKQYL